MNKYLCIVKKEFKTRSIYNFATLMTLISVVLLFSMKIVLFGGMAKAGAISDKDFKNLVYYSFFVVLIQNTFLYGIMNKNAQEIRSGMISYSFLKPMSLFVRSIFEVLGLRCYSFVFVVIPLYLVMSILYSPVLFHFSSVFAFIAFLGCFLFVILFEEFLSAIVFFIMNTWGLDNMKRGLMLLLGGQFIPIQYYPETLQSLVKVLPFQYFFDFPIHLLMGEMITIRALLNLVFWNIVVYLLYKYTYMKGVRRVVVQGS